MKKKLTLRSITIANLTPLQLAGVAGGNASKAGSYCMSCYCITPSCIHTT